MFYDTVHELDGCTFFFGLFKGWSKGGVARPFHCLMYYSFSHSEVQLAQNKRKACMWILSACENNHDHVKRQAKIWTPYVKLQSERLFTE